MKKNKILIIDDEINILKYVSACLRATGYDAVTAGDGREGLLKAENENPDMIILDIKMPNLDGFIVCERLREWTQVPIIMLSAIGDEADKVKCLNLGADDYITKPFSTEELLARVAAVLRRAEINCCPPVRSAFRSGELCVSFAERCVTVAGKEINLTPTEYNLLQELVLNAGKVLTHAYLLNKVWGAEYLQETDYLHTFIRRLRRKLESEQNSLKNIITVPGVGYKFKK